MEFLLSFLGRHLAGKPVVTSPNVGCFLKLTNYLNAKVNIKFLSVLSLSGGQMLAEKRIHQHQMLHCSLGKYYPFNKFLVFLICQLSVPMTVTDSNRLKLH